MNIIEAIKAVMAKKKVRRKCQNKEYFNKSDYIYMCNKAYRPDYSSPVNQFNIDDILADDWEVVE